jgi:hypothetical protein
MKPIERPRTKRPLSVPICGLPVSKGIQTWDKRRKRTDPDILVRLVRRKRTRVTKKVDEANSDTPIDVEDQLVVAKKKKRNDVSGVPLEFQRRTKARKTTPSYARVSALIPPWRRFSASPRDHLIPIIIPKQNCERALTVSFFAVVTFSTASA